jgi:hypothetical protein
MKNCNWHRRWAIYPLRRRGAISLLALGLGIFFILAGLGIGFFTPMGWIGGVAVGAFGALWVGYFVYIILSPTAQNKEVEGLVRAARDMPNRLGPHSHWTDRM